MHNAHAHSHNDRFLLQTTVYAQRCSMFYFAKRHICEEHKMKCKQNIYDFATYMLQACYFKPECSQIDFISLLKNFILRLQ